MPAENGTGRQETYQYYDSSLDGKILKIGNVDTLKTEGSDKMSFSGHWLKFYKDPTNIYGGKTLEQVVIYLFPYNNQIVGKLTGRWGGGTRNFYDSCIIYEVKLFNPEKTGLGDFTYYVNLELDIDKRIETNTNLLLLTDDGTVTGKVYKCHEDRAVMTTYFPHHDPDYPTDDCKKWDEYFGNLAWTGTNCPMWHTFDSHTPESSRLDLKTWHGYSYVPKRSVAPFERSYNGQEYYFNEDGDTKIYVGQTSTTVNFSEFRFPWLGAKIHNYGVCMATIPNPTREDNLLYDALLDYVENGEGTRFYFPTKIFPKYFYTSKRAIFTGLTPSTTYYVKMWEEVWGDAALGENPNTLYTKYSAQGVFATSNVITEPEVAIGTKVFGLTASSASFKLWISQFGDGVDEYGVCYKPGTGTPTIADQTVIQTAEDRLFSSTVTMVNCNPGTLYTFLPYAIRKKGQIDQEVFYCNPLAIHNYILQGSGANNIFTTTSGPKRKATVIMDAPLWKGVSTAAIPYRLTDNGNTLIKDEDIGVCWGTSPNPTIADNKKNDFKQGRGEYEYRYVDVEDLNPEAKYYFRAYVTNSEGTYYSSEQNITTDKKKTADEIITFFPTSGLSKNGIDINFGLNLGNSAFTALGICYSLSATPTIAGDKVDVLDVTVGYKTAKITGLESNKTYYYRAYFTDTNGTSYSKQYTFTTLKNIVPPSLTTEGVEKTDTLVKLKMKVTSNGGDVTCENYIAYSKLPLSTSVIPGNAQQLTSNTGEFTLEVLKSELTAGTYYYVAYSKNSAGVQAGVSKQFIIDDVSVKSIPTLLNVVTNITKSSVYFNSEVTSLGNSTYVSGSLQLIKVSTGEVVEPYNYTSTTSARSYGDIANLLPATQYKLVLKARTQYLVDNSLPDAISEVTFTTLADTTPPHPSTLAVTCSLNNRVDSVAKISISISEVKTGQTVVLYTKVGSAPTSSYYDSKVDISNTLTQTRDVILPTAGTWYIVAIVTDSTKSYQSVPLIVPIGYKSTVDPITGLSLYPSSGQSETVKGKRWVYSGTDKAWQRDYTYTENTVQRMSRVQDLTANAPALAAIDVDKQLQAVRDELADNTFLIRPVVLQSITTAPELEYGNNYNGYKYYNSETKKIIPAYTITGTLYAWVEVEAVEPNKTVIYNFNGLSYMWNDEDLVPIKMYAATKYKVYLAKISQIGTDAPTVVVLENTIGNIVWTRDSVGQYEATLAGAFSGNTLFMQAGNIFFSWNDEGVVLNYTKISENVLRFNVYKLSDFTAIDDSLRDTIIEIRVYD